MGKIEDRLNQYKLSNINKALIDTQNLHNKIKLMSKKLDVRFEFLLAKILTSDQLYPLFIYKDPARQNLTETIVCNLIKESISDINIKILPKSGNNALYLVSGQIIKGKKNVQKFSDHSKSIDLLISNYKRKTFYISHKLIRDKGGGQDNQFKEQLLFIKNALNNLLDDNFIFVALCDGEYFQSKKIKQILDSLPKKKNVLIFDTLSFIKYLKNIKNGKEK